MKRLFNRQTLTCFLMLSLCLSFLPIDMAEAQRRGGGGGRAGASRSGGRPTGTTRTRSSGASQRTNSNVNLQNRGNVNSNYTQRDRSNVQQNRQTPSTDRQSNRQDTQQGRQDNRTERSSDRQDFRSDTQDNRTERTEIRQENRTERTEIRQDNRTDRQGNRQDFVDDNRYYGWRGGWYGRGYYVPPGWGWVGFTTGLIIGAAIATPPPYYSTVYVGSTTYIYSDGVYLEPKGDEYIVVAPPEGAIVTYIPDGCTEFQLNGAMYYDCEGIYYQPVYQDGSPAYQVVSL